MKPFSIFKKKPKEVAPVSCVQMCPKSTKCPKWVVLTDEVTCEDGTKVKKLEGKCADAWVPTLLIELKELIKNARRP